jgi:hypothetical protein
VSYTCKNRDCSAPENKKGKEYPYAMECPFCDIALSEIISLLGSELKLIDSLPYVIAYPLRRTFAEKHNWTKINLFKDTFLNYLKYLGLIIASEFFNSKLKNKKMVRLFQSAISEPSFGSWNQYIRETIEYLKKEDHIFFCPELVTYYENIETIKHRKLYKGEIQYIDSNGDIQLKKQEASAIGMLINFRNRYLGHGLTLDENSSIILWDKYFPIFNYLLEEMKFSENYPMFKNDYGNTYLLNSANIVNVEKGAQPSGRVWLENVNGHSMNILPFYVVPGEVLISKEEKDQILVYESYTGKTIKFFSPEGTERHTSGKILENLNLLLRDKLNEVPHTPLTFNKEIFLSRISEENKIILDGLVAEKKIIPGLYIHRQEIEIKLKEWIGAKSNIFFLAAEAGSGKTNLLIEIGKDYTKKGLPNLLIRAGRIDKKTLKDHICYVLNISSEYDFQKYSFFERTQNKPTIILIDGLNESGNVENIWQEIVELCKIYDNGCLKFVITYRANNKSDLDIFKIDENHNKLVFHTNKETGFFVHWLTSMNMEETELAWKAYSSYDKNKYSPNFTFNDLAFFDRSIFNQINNPLILRLFLETYNKKSLTKRNIKYLNIWIDWFEKFSTNEKLFFKLLAEEIWKTGENELLLDDLLKNENIKPYLINDLINAPYRKLKNNGWISYYIKDLNVCIGFTVEGVLIYLLGKILDENKNLYSLEKLKSLIQNGTKLQNVAIESYLGLLAAKKDIELVIDLIDSGIDKIDICINPLLLYTKAEGIQATVEKLIKDPTENDWKVLVKFYEHLKYLQLLEYKRLFSDLLYTHIINLEIKVSLNLLIRILNDLGHPKNENLSCYIEKEIDKMGQSEPEVLALKDELAFYYSMNGYPEKGIIIYNEIYGDIDNIQDPIILNKIGAAYDNCNNEEKAVKFYLAAKEKLLNLPFIDNNLIGMIYYNLAKYQHNLTEKIQYYEKALEYEIKEYGKNHISSAMTLCAIGLIEIEKGAYEKALKKINLSYNIINELGGDKEDILSFYGYYYDTIQDYSKALAYYEKSFEAGLLKYGINGISLRKVLTDIGRVYEKNGDDSKSLEFFLKADNLLSAHENKNFNDIFYIKGTIGYFYFYSSKYSDSIKYLKDSIDIHLNYKSKYTSKEINTVFYYLGYSYYCISDFVNALEVMKNIENLSIEEINEENFIYNNELLGNIYFYLRNYLLAIDTYNRIYILIKDLEKKIEITGLIASAFVSLNEYDKAINYYNECISLGKSIDINYDLSNYYYQIGLCFEKTKDYDIAVYTLKEGYNLFKKVYFLELIAKCLELNNNKLAAFDYFLQYAKLMQNDSNEGVISSSTIDSVNNVKRLAKELDREKDLPEWLEEI